MDTASQGDEMKVVQADLDWIKRTKEAGTELEEMVLIKIVFHLHNQRSAGTAVKQIKITSHASSHQAILQKFTEADGEPACSYEAS